MNTKVYYYIDGEGEDKSLRKLYFDKVVQTYQEECIRENTCRGITQCVFIINGPTLTISNDENIPFLTMYDTQNEKREGIKSKLEKEVKGLRLR